MDPQLARLRDRFCKLHDSSEPFDVVITDDDGVRLPVSIPDEIDVFDEDGVKLSEIPDGIDWLDAVDEDGVKLSEKPYSTLDALGKYTRFEKSVIQLGRQFWRSEKCIRRATYFVESPLKTVPHSVKDSKGRAVNPVPHADPICEYSLLVEIGESQLSLTWIEALLTASQRDFAVLPLAAESLPDGSIVLRDVVECSIALLDLVADTTRRNVLDPVRRSPWLDRRKFIMFLKHNKSDATSPRTIGRLKAEWNAEPRPGTNNREFRFRLRDLEQAGMKIPPDWERNFAP